jgi:hypothetical protein
MYFDQRILGDCCKFLIVVSKSNVGDSGTVSDDRFCNRFIGLSTEQRNRAIITSRLIDNYSPPTKKSTELLLSQDAAQYSRDELDFEEIVEIGTAVFL